MRGSQLCDVLKDQLGAKNDSELARYLAVAPATISLMRSSRQDLTERRIAKFIKRTVDHKAGLLFENAVRPIVEFFDIRACESKQGAKWLPFAVKDEPDLHRQLLSAKGLYAYYNSEGEIIYVGRTNKNLFDEMVSAYNRPLPSYHVYKVKHAWGRFTPNTAEKIRQIGRRNVTIADTAFFFSCTR